MFSFSFSLYSIFYNLFIFFFGSAKESQASHMWCDMIWCDKELLNKAKKLSIRICISTW